ncbi:MAG: helix-turn-helix transcriptional regulator [Draconibacterium sp.]|nr:helix-turn-helix transcriptional regulator [Draconibacterium sp.]
MEKIKKIIERNEYKCFRFHPNSEFYQTIKIKQKRWGQIYRGETSPTVDELKSIAEFFNAEVTELI